MYKVIYGDKVIDVIKHSKFIKFLSSGHVAMTDKGSAQGVVGSDGKTLYSFAPVIGQDILIVTLEEISENEFSRLLSLLNSNQEISADE